MDEADARRVLLVRAFETAAPAGPLWTAEDREWATRAARESRGADAPPEAWLAERARLAMQRLAPRDPTLARRAAAAPRTGRHVALAVVLGLALGVAADAVGPTQRVNLLAPPVWAVIAWNLLVYLWLALAVPVRALAGTAAAPAGGPLRAWIARLWSPADLPVPAGGGPAASRIEAAAAFGALWSRHAGPIAGARAATVLHAAAAALAAGLVAGLYVRGLVLDYRAGWQSTFLEGPTVHALLAAAFAPASALTGVAVPEAAAVEALRMVPGGVAGPAARGGASAAPWIHLYAATLAVAVILPRALLAAWQGWRARRLSARVALPLGDPYYQSLLRAQRGAAATLLVVPHAAPPSAQAALGLRAVMARVFGDPVRLHLSEPAAFGREEDVVLPALDDAAAVLAIFDLAATPEPEQQGRLMQSLARAAGATPLVMLVDEAAFVRRFGARSERHQQRRAAWRHFAETRSWPIVFADLDTPDVERVRTAFEAALQPR